MRGKFANVPWALQLQKVGCQALISSSMLIDLVQLLENIVCVEIVVESKNVLFGHLRFTCC